MDLVFLGSGAFGVPTLARLVQSHAVRAIVTQPDKPAGRGSQLTPTPVAQWAAEHAPGVPVLKPAKVNAAEVVAQIRGYQPRAMVVIAFGQKVGRALLEDLFAINLHASLLPRWRGAAPINAAVLAGDTETGNSVISLADRMDAGLVYAQSRRPIYPDLTAGELHDLLAEDGPALVEQVLTDFASGTTKAVQQDESLVTLAPKLSRADGWVDFRATAEECRRRIHGLTPWPGITAMIEGKPLKLARVQVADSAAQQQPGTVIDPQLGLIACGQDTSLRLLEVQPPGKRRMSWPDFARGNRIQMGSVLVGRATEC